MNTKMLFDAIRGLEDDPRPIILEVRMRDSICKKVLEGVGFDEKGIYLCAGQLTEDAPEPERRTVQPVPSSPHVGPDGEFYPMG